MIVNKIKEKALLFLFCLIMIYFFTLISVIVLLMFIFQKNKSAHKYLKRAWLHLTMSALSIYFPKPIYIYYDPVIILKKKNIVISNHLSEYDWLMILAILYKFNRYDDICIILKHTLKNIPLLGYGMKYFGFIFLNRKLDADKEILKTGLQILKNKQKYDLLIFPEGTYIDKEGKEKSDNYIIKNPVFLDGTKFCPQEVLLPRVTGFNIIYDNLGNDMEGVIDITLFTNPYTSLPQEKYTYYKALTDFNDRIGYSCFIEFVDKPAKNNFIFSRFKNKDEFIKKYKNVCSEGFKSLDDFIFKFKKIHKEIEGYKFDEVSIKSYWGPFFTTIFIFILIIVIYVAYKISKSFIGVFK